MSDRITLPVPAHALPGRTPRELLAMAHTGLAEAAEMTAPGMQYATAHLSALRAAAAMLAARAIPARRPGEKPHGVTSVWSLLVVVAPELADWAARFAATASKRAAAEAGIPRVVTVQEADDMVRAAGQFVDVVEVMVGG